jgi:hypothetical protein
MDKLVCFYELKPGDKFKVVILKVGIATGIRTKVVEEKGVKFNSLITYNNGKRDVTIPYYIMANDIVERVFQESK